ncbi:MAG: pimeloyl-ACP methyl ester carboxylesterase [Myxococcota bacterium]|jgi:pimeloyl-ACP methyl ester carboxylesterase
MIPGFYRGLEEALRFRVRAAGLRPVTIQVPTGSVHGWVGGSGPPLLLVHGFGGDALWCWHPQIRALARHRTLLVPDLPYFGFSKGDDQSFGLHDQAGAIHAWLDALGVRRVDAVGISYGGLVLQALIQAEPALVRRLVLVDSPGPTYTDDDHAGLLNRFDVQDVADIVVPERWEDVRRLIELAWYQPPPTPRWLLRQVYTHMFTDRREQKRQLLRSLDDLRAELGAGDYTLPPHTLLLWGAEDPLFPPEVGARFAATRSDARLVVLDRTRHAPNLEASRAFNRHVLTALR